MATTRIAVVEGDITTLEVDAIVDAADSGLTGGGGVDGAIHRAAGPALSDACRQMRGECVEGPAGEAVITPAGRLPMRHILHAVGPTWHGGDSCEPRRLADP